MSLTLLTAIISVAAALSGILVGWLGQARAAKQQTKEQGRAEADLASDLKHIKDIVERIETSFSHEVQRVEGRIDQVAKEADDAKETAIIARESAKSAHRRIDSLVNK